MAQIFNTAIFSVIDTDSSLGVGWKLFFYDTGTSNAKDTYPTEADADAGTNALSNPVVSAADGRFVPIWLGSGQYKAVLKDENDVTLETVDPANDLDNKTTFSTVALLLASTLAAIGAGTIWRAAGYVYKEAASGASDHNLTTAGGVKLYVLPDQAGAVHLSQWGLAMDGTVAHDSILTQAQAIDGVMTIVGPGNGNTLRFDSTISYDLDGADWRFGTSIIDCSNNSGIAIQTTSSLGVTYQEKKAAIYGGLWRGPGKATSGSIGVQISGSSNNAAGRSGRIVDAAFKDFETGWKIGSNGYIFTWENCEVHDCAIGLHFPTSLTNAGENLRNIACVVGACDLGIKIEGYCGYVGLGSSYDYNIKTIEMTSNGNGSISLHGCHIEFQAEDLTDFPIEMSNVDASLTMHGGTVIPNLGGSGWAAGVGSFIDCDGYAFFKGVEWFGVRPPTSFDTGTGTVIVDDGSYTASSSMTPVRANISNNDPTFADNDILSDNWLIYADSATPPTGRHSGTNLALTVTNGVTPATGTYSLRMAKSGGGGTGAQVALLVPCRPGDLHYAQLDVMTPDGLTQEAYLVYMFFRLDGFDAANDAFIGDYENYAAIAFNPSASWTTINGGGVLDGGHGNRCPDWATHFGLGLNFNNSVGSASGASEDGGALSVYIDNARIYKWR